MKNQMKCMEQWKFVKEDVGVGARWEDADVVETKFGCRTFSWIRRKDFS